MAYYTASSLVNGSGVASAIGEGKKYNTGRALPN